MSDGLSIELPFKPFTLDEVYRLTKCPSKFVDRWLTLNKLQYMHSPETKGYGFSWMQSFAIFVAHRYLTEGAGHERADGVLDLLVIMHHEALIGNLNEGNVFAAPACMMKSMGRRVGRGTLIPMPEGGKYGRLHLGDLLVEFEHNIKEVFPNG